MDARPARCIIVAYSAADVNLFLVDTARKMRYKCARTKEIRLCAIHPYFFDLDGTLLDTLGDLTAAMNRTLTRHGLPERTRQQMRTALGNGARRLMELSVPVGNGQCAVRNAAGGIQRRLCRPLPH